MAARARITQYAGTGRRKSATARVLLRPVEGDEPKFLINGKAFEEYFPLPTTQMVVRQPLESVEQLGKFNIMVRVDGGGVSGQAGAVVHGLARALTVADADLRPTLKKGGFLTRDPREVERKKPGRHKARKKPQFSKR